MAAQRQPKHPFGVLETAASDYAIEWEELEEDARDVVPRDAFGLTAADRLALGLSPTLTRDVRMPAAASEDARGLLHRAFRQ